MPASVSEGASSSADLGQHQLGLNAEKIRMKAEQKNYEVQILLLGGKPVTAPIGEDQDAHGLDDMAPGIDTMSTGFDTLSGDDAARVATLMDSAVLANELSPGDVLQLAQNMLGGTDELIDILSRSDMAALPGSSLQALSEALFQRAEGTDLGDAAAASHVARSGDPAAGVPSTDAQASLFAVLSAQQALDSGGQDVGAVFEQSYSEFIVGPFRQPEIEDPIRF